MLYLTLLIGFYTDEARRLLLAPYYQLQPHINTPPVKLDPTMLMTGMIRPRSILMT
jgi:hypothetical protein